MKRLSKNLLSIILSDVARRIVGFLATVYLARIIGTSGFGAINIGFTVLSYALIATSLGMTSYGIREVARGADRSLVGAIVTTRLRLGILSYALAAAVALLFVEDTTTSHLILLFGLSVFVSPAIIDWYFQGREQMGLVGAGRMVSAVIYLLTILLFVDSPGEIVLVAIGAVAGDAVAFAVLLAACARQGVPVFRRMDLNESLDMLRRSMPFGIGSIVANLSVNLAPVVIGIILVNADVGLFSASSKIVFFLLALDRLFGTLLLPAASRYQAVAPDQLPGILDTAARYIVIAAVPISIGGTILGNHIIPTVFGTPYVDAVPAFRILIWYFFFTMIHTVFSSGVLAVGGERIYRNVMLLSGFLYLGLTVAGTLVYGIVGAAAGVVVAEAVTLFLMQRECAKYVRVMLGRHILRTIPAAAALALTLLLIPGAGLIVSVLVGWIVYSVVLFLSRTFGVSDIQNLLGRI